MIIRVADIGAQFLETWGMAWVLFTSKEVTHRLNIDSTPGTLFLLFIFDFRLLVPSISQRKLVVNDLHMGCLSRGPHLTEKVTKNFEVHLFPDWIRPRVLFLNVPAEMISIDMEPYGCIVLARKTKTVYGDRAQLRCFVVSPFLRLESPSLPISGGQKISIDI